MTVAEGRWGAGRGGEGEGREGLRGLLAMDAALARVPVYITNKLRRRLDVVGGRIARAGRD